MKSRREFLTQAATASAAVALGEPSAALSESSQAVNQATSPQNKAEDPRITRARAAGPAEVTRDATVALIDKFGTMTVLVQGSNEWVCTPGDENVIGEPPMCMNPLGMQWMMDAKAKKPKPTNPAPGIIYMLCGATQHSTTDPTDHSSPAIPIGPHWMVTWPFDARDSGLPATARDKGAWVMFDGTPYAYLHICGHPWSGTEYKRGTQAVWTMRYLDR